MYSTGIFQGVQAMDRDQDALPLFNALLKHANQGKARFHVPGHKGGRFFSPQGIDTFRSILSIDLTELDGLDYLHAPQGVIKEAETLAARQFGADRTYFLVNGSTVGNLAMILGCIERGDVVLVQRNCHQSVYHALSMAEAQAVPLTPQIDPLFQVAANVHPGHFHKVLSHYPQARACFLTYPTYYGWAKPDELHKIIDLAHQHGLLVLIDEAHGAHFGQHPGLPPSAMQLGADLSVQSTHKMLSALTMTAMLHLRLGRVPVQDIEMYLSMLQSSSPSYPLLASLDLARQHVGQLTPAQWDQCLKGVARLREHLARELGEGYLISKGEAPQEDPFKLIIRSRFGLSGFDLKHALRKQGIEIELADPGQVCLTLPLNPCPEWEHSLITALKRIASFHGKGISSSISIKGINPLDSDRTLEVPEPIALQIYRSKAKERIPLKESIGRQAAEMVTAYPPGIPLLIPGETITREHVENILYYKEAGAFFPGALDDEPTLPVLVNLL
jgi:arginine/lysine/ornithine decarboxylase